MNPERERRIESTAAYAAGYIAIAPEPSDCDQYTFGSCNLGSAFCSISPTVEELVELKAHIKPHEGDFLALFISLN